MSNHARVLFMTVFLLVGMGIVMTYSSSAVYAQYRYANPEYFLFRQFMYTLLGTFLMFVTASVPVNFWKNNSRAMMLLSISFLILVYVPVIGHSGGGAQRWINLGIVNFQPAEFAKVTVCVYLSDYLSRKMKIIKKGGILVFLPPLMLVGLTCCLTILQPDLGSTAFICLLVSILFFLSGLRMRYVAIAAAVMLPALYVLVIRVPYRAARVTAYLNPWNDPQGSGFQIIQSLLAFGIGGIKGEGLGQGIQKLFYLPSSYNDFIFSVIGEEMGLIGLVTVEILYAIILFCGLGIAQKAKGDFERLLTIALTLMIVLQALIHMMVTTGLIPTKGLPLPFVSFGGTSLLFSMMAVGLLLACDRKAARSN